MTAKEMFKKLGYNVKFENNNCIYYANTEILKEFKFDKEYKIFYIIGSKTIFGDELQAIHKQVEELQWTNRNMEEEKKTPEKIKLYAPYPECEDTRFEEVENKINEIIDYLKSKGE